MNISVNKKEYEELFAERTRLEIELNKIRNDPMPCIDIFPCPRCRYDLPVSVAAQLWFRHKMAAEEALKHGRKR